MSASRFVDLWLSIDISVNVLPAGLVDLRFFELVLPCVESIDYTLYFQPL